MCVIKYFLAKKIKNSANEFSLQRITFADSHNPKACLTIKNWKCGEIQQRHQNSSRSASAFSMLWTKRDSIWFRYFVKIFEFKLRRNCYVTKFVFQGQPRRQHSNKPHGNEKVGCDSCWILQEFRLKVWRRYCVCELLSVVCSTGYFRSKLNWMSS